MAISEHERNLLTAFWEKHRLLILAAFYAISNDPNQDEKLREDANLVLQSLGKKDYSRYSISLDGKTVAHDVRKTAVGREVARVLIDAGISKKEFADLKADRSSSFPLLKLESEIKDVEIQYNRYRVAREEPLTYSGHQYHVSGNWGENNIPKFQSFLEKRFPRVQLRKQETKR